MVAKVVTFLESFIAKERGERRVLLDGRPVKSFSSYREARQFIRGERAIDCLWRHTRKYTIEAAATRQLPRLTKVAA
jgi:hypothetical protein